MKIIQPGNCNVGTINDLPNGRPTREPVKNKRTSDRRKGEQYLAKKKSFHVKVSRAQSGAESPPDPAPPERYTHTDKKNEKDKKGSGSPKEESDLSEGSTTPNSIPTMKKWGKPNVGKLPRGRHSNGEHSKWRPQKNCQDAQESANIKEEKKKNDPLPEGGSSPHDLGGLSELEEDSSVWSLSSENSSDPCDNAKRTNCNFAEDVISTHETLPMREVLRENQLDPSRGASRIVKTPICWKNEVHETARRSCNGEEATAGGREANRGPANGDHVVTEERQSEDDHPKRDTPSDGANNGDDEERDKRAFTPPNEIDQLKEEIKRELYNRLSIALDMNMSLNEKEKYYDLFKKKKKFQKYIMKSCKFVIILGKHLNLSFSIIAMALYYLHKYNEKVLRRKKNALPYLIGGACIFLAWKMREDIENLKRTKKLYDIPKMIFKLLNYFDKKKKIKKKMRELQIGMVLSGRAYQKWEDLSDEHTFGSIEHTAGNAAKEEEASGRRHGEEETHPPGEASQGGSPPRSGKKKRKLSPKGDVKKPSTEPSETNNLHRDLAQIKRIISAGYVSDVNNIGHVSDCFNSYLSECNSRDVSECELEGGKHSTHDDLYDGPHDDLPDDIPDDIPDDLGDAPEEPPPQTYLTHFQHLCKREKRKIHISASKWVLKNSGQKLQLMQKVIIYYEGEILKSINYFLKPDKFSFDLFPFFIGTFVSIMKGYVTEEEVTCLQKIASLSFLDYYKTPLCLVFTSKEIMVASILRAYISLKWICGKLDLQKMSLQDFEKKATRFTQHVSSKNPISITRVKMALREIRLFSE
ncbi:Uncharacterized protein PCOAH_00002020 [Plasmodium coatneyi]|uniref:Uncharacterized protein n=1 Tax=Plasmodium coatneyi TaxID=208452 RepID=A0A1B1DSU2_9APIC|nr:Uncharacterized protein PCOAH_00002020 [Plasmodium coatneyi]ANQ05812.1 Uncharacterized protein PCOAH_00002020 [Plasmodium coatneyi]